jgi:hypothetical protein
MEGAIHHKILRDLPWAENKLVKVVVMVNKDTGIWNGAWVITVWTETFYAKAFEAVINYHKATTKTGEEGDGSRVAADEDGNPVVNYRYDPWLPAQVRTGSKSSSGMVATLEDAR